MSSSYGKRWFMLFLFLGAFFFMGLSCQPRQVVYVIGGYGWMAQFMDQNGNIATNGVDGVNTQYNLENMLIKEQAGFVAYEPDQQEPKPYDCGSCHTTGFSKAGEPAAEGYAGSDSCRGCHSNTDRDIIDGFSESGHQHIINRVSDAPPELPFSEVPAPPDTFSFGKSSDYNTTELPGIKGQWVEKNIGCEACHGPSADHVADIKNIKPSLEIARTACSKCHIRGTPDSDGMETVDNVIATDGNLIKYRQEWEEWNASPHNAEGGPDCADCHNPHATSKYGDRAKINGRNVYTNDDCLRCHAGLTIGLGMSNLMCIDCHMPNAVKAAYGYPIIGAEGNYAYVADQRSHQFKINTENNASEFFDKNKNVRLDSNGKVLGLTLNLVCQPCHSANGLQPHGLPAAEPLTFLELQAKSSEIHNAP